jgi:hypothetical protein
MEPVVVECSSACTVTLVHGGPFVLSVADGAVLSFLVIGVWLTAAAFRWMYGVVLSNRDAD